MPGAPPNDQPPSPQRQRDFGAEALSDIFDALPQAIFWKSRDGVYLGCNRAFADIAGLAQPARVAGLTDRDMPWLSEDAEDYLASDREVMDGDRARRDILEPIRGADGAKRWVRTSKSPLHDAGGRVIGVLGIFEDVTESLRTAEALRATQRMLQTVLDTIPARVFWKDRDCVYLGCNRIFAKDAGLERPEDIIGLTDRDVGWRDQADLYRADDRAVIDSGVPKLDYEEPQTTPTGDTIWLRTSKIPLRDEDGEIIGVMGTYEDITARKRAEEERLRLEAGVQHAQKLESLGVLAGGIAHDFNNLLVAILGYADLAREDLPGADPARASIDGIRLAALRAAELTNQLLAYSGKGHFVVRCLSLNDVVREMGQLLEASIPKKIAIRYAMADGLPAVEVDATQIRQVVMNLVTNAAEALGDRVGVITLSTGKTSVPAGVEPGEAPDARPAPGDYVYFEVRDDGCGMDADMLPRIFDPFFTTKFAGRGLGLAAVQGIVRGHRGGMQVRSEVGRGTRFRILLPASACAPETVSAAAPAEPAVAAPRAPAGRRGTVLVVDDEQVVRDIASQMLERAGFSVITAPDGAAGLALFRERRAEIRLVLLDMTMPRMDGEEAYRELRGLDPALRVVLTSGYNEQDATSRFVGRGLAGFIQKPFTMEKLRAVIEKALG